MKTIGACMLVLVMIIGCDDDSSGNNGTNNVNNVNNNINNINNLNNVDLCAGIDCSGHGACVVDGQGLAACDCDPGYEADGLACVSSTDPCAGIGCSGHGTCVNEAGVARCSCEGGYSSAGPAGDECVPTAGAASCEGVTCSGQGTCREWTETSGPVAVCACNGGHTPSGSHGLDCVPVELICTGGFINYDFDNDGTVDTWFDPVAVECEMFALINLTRATHDHEGTPECHRPLMYSVEWSAHGRNHSHQMSDQGGLFHADYPSGQNCAYGCDPACEMNMYMTGPSEPHCPDLSHHCNIMRCSFGSVGVGTVGTFNTQNFL
ncbi:MAG: hypothetical protein CVU65_10910 [Deltaproteobacteria bacterium HGW-Deltaproteobacteria-22]|nr:MAG: hypothetical protein CVU65_10910 [Deltaproteobacteria bacterium HGW-Deltaproteobacteria-22]